MSFVQPPPIAEPTPPPVVHQGFSQSAKKKAPWILTALAFLAAKAKTALYLLYGAFKFLKIGKVLLTGGSMLVSIWFYAMFFGWQFAVGFVICIFIHEMGHVFVAWRQGQPITSPVF